MAHWKRRFAAFGAAVCLLTGCGASGQGAEQTELVVFAAASLTESLTELGARYMAEAPDVSLSFNFDSSGTLKTQIEEGAACDLFLSAAPQQMDALDGVRQDTRRDLLENRVVLAVPDGDPASIGSFDGLAARLRTGGILFAMGNADVPVGQYTEAILDSYGLDGGALAAAGCITYASNVKEIVSQIREGAVDCGAVYQTDARAAGLTVVDLAPEALCGRVVYPAAVLEGAAEPAAARDFLEYLAGDTAAAVFEAAGFVPLD